jgi:hypothetical protein
MRSEDFTHELIVCCNTKRSNRRVYTSWEPDGTAAPERHVLNGIQANLSADEICETLLQKNRAFDTIQSMLDITMNTSFFKYLKKDICEEKEHVWLFAQRWVAKYYEYLMEPDVFHSSFYRQEHDRFIDLLTKMCTVLPEKRPSFAEALRVWSPGEYNEESDDDDELPPQPAPNGGAPNGDASVCAESPSDGAVSSVTDGPSTSLQPSSDSSAVRRRLALKVFHDRQGRNKTRRSSRN